MKTFLLASAALLGSVFARCPNGCSNQGLCGPNSQCKCYRNFQGSDCSERVCYYALSFVDTPAGDLNADGAIGMTLTFEEGSQDYATEGYPLNYGVARPVDGSSESGRWDEGHFYRECSNKGLCNRKTGQCACFPGYEGEGCQRTTCPGTSAGVTCSGHGLCLNAYHKLGSTYGLWDKEKTMKCECDKGYSGPDCSIRQCPQGPDPVAHSDKVTTSLQKIAFGAFTYKSAFLQEEDSFDKVMSGPVYFTVTVTDDYGDEWTTNTLSINYITTCHTGATDNCRSKPVFNPEPLGTDCTTVDLQKSGDGETVYTAGSYECIRNMGYMRTNNADGFDWYAKNTIADDLNVSLQGLPNGAVKEPYVWMWYTDKSNQLAGTTSDHLSELSLNPTAQDLTDPKKTVLQNEEYIWKEAKKAQDDNPVDASLPTPAEAVRAVYTSFTRLRANDIKYPSANYEGKALYWESPRTRYPDFNSNGDQDQQWQDCGRVDDTEDVNSDGKTLPGKGRARAEASPSDSVSSTEGLCLYVSSSNKVVTNYRVTYTYNAEVSAGADSLNTVAFLGKTQVGESENVETDKDGDQRFVTTPKSTNLIADEPVVTVEEVGKDRYWDVNKDGYPERSYGIQSGDKKVSTFTVHECSKRGLCATDTGECQCFSGYTGTSCNAQNAISYSS